MKFLNHLTFGQYMPADSFIHRMDPRAKILGVIFLLTGIFMVKTLLMFSFWFIILFSLTLFSKISLSVILRSAKPVIILVLFTVFIHIFFTKGQILYSLGFITITLEGIQMGIHMGLRLLLLVLYASLLTLTTSPMELADGLEKLFTPFKKVGFPAHELAMMMTIALRFIPTLLDETDRIMKAQLARGADLDRGSILKRLKAFIPVLVPLFVIVFQRAEDLALAMESRCYKGGRGRTRMNPLHWSKGDTLAFTATVFMVFLIMYIDRSLVLI